MRVLTNILRLVSVPAGVVIGLWTAQLTPGSPCGTPPPGVLSGCPEIFAMPTFAAWECALFGAGAAVVLVLVAEGVTRLRSPKQASSSAP